MFSNLNLNRWTSSISAAAITVVGIFGSVSSPADAQTTCTRRTAGTTALSGAGVPTNVLTFARSNTPTGVTLTRLADIEQEGSTTIYELRGYRSNGCSVEVDVIRTTTLRLDEVEEQLASVIQLPQLVRNTLASRARGFTATLIERSTRPGGVVIYELEGTLNGQGREIDINADGTLISIQAAS